MLIIIDFDQKKKVDPMKNNYKKKTKERVSKKVEFVPEWNSEERISRLLERFLFLKCLSCY